MLSRLSAGALWTAIVGTGGMAVTNPEWLGIDTMPSFHSLAKDRDYEKRRTEKNYKDDSFGVKYRNYLFGVWYKEDETNNIAWLDKSFYKLKTTGRKVGQFKYEEVDVGSIKLGERYKALNAVCREAFEKREDELKGDNVEITDEDYPKSDVWKYCSPLGKEPEKVKGEQYQDQIGSEKGANFASIEEGVNDMFWIIREKEVRGGDEDNFEKITITGVESDTYFKDTSKTLRELCGKAYKLPVTGGDSSPDVDTVKKYCEISIYQS